MNNIDKELKIRRDYRDRISLLEKQNCELIREKEKSERILFTIVLFIFIVAIFVIGILTGVLYERGLLV